MIIFTPASTPARRKKHEQETPHTFSPFYSLLVFFCYWGCFCCCLASACLAEQAHSLLDLLFNRPSANLLPKGNKLLRSMGYRSNNQGALLQAEWIGTEREVHGGRFGPTPSGIGVNIHRGEVPTVDVIETWVLLCSLSSKIFLESSTRLSSVT